MKETGNPCPNESSEQMEQRSFDRSKPVSVSRPLPTLTLQRQCARGNHALGGECDECRKKHEGLLQRSATTLSSACKVPPIVHEVLRSPGQPLDSGTRALTKRRFGHDFSHVRTGAADVGPDWIVTVLRGSGERDAKFPWRLLVTGVPCNCDAVQWEQFVAGGFTIHHEDGTSRYYSACDTMQRINSRSRRFGRWCDDLLPDMKPGPWPVSEHPDAVCSGGVTGTQKPGTMQGPHVTPAGASYTFGDAPGFGSDFGDTINGKIFAGISWSTDFEHKVWCASQDTPIRTKRFSLTGKYLSDGVDTRTIT